MKLYEIKAELESCWDSDTGEILDIEKLEQMEMAYYEKAENIAKYIKNLNADIEALKKEKQEFAKRQSVKEHKVDSLKKYLSGVLNGEKFETTDVKISYRKSEALEIDNLEDLYKTASDYIDYKPEIKKSELKKAIKDGVEISGAHIETKNNIQIR